MSDDLFLDETFPEEALVDKSINSDLVDTRGPDDVLFTPTAQGNVAIPTMRTVSARTTTKPSWINVHHGNYNISKRNGSYKYIAVHYTGAQSPAYPNALNNCKYFSGGNRNASAHYFIDNAGVWEYADPDSYCTWHVGDGAGKYGITNSNAIGIEVCQQGDNPFSEDEIKHLTNLIAWLRSKYGISTSNVVRHWDASRKSCPYYYAGTGTRQERWNSLWSRITGGQVTSSTGSDSSGSRPVLSQGSSGSYVKEMQEKLAAAGYDLGSYGADGSFGPSTLDALKAFQKDNGLEVDGYCGPATWAALDKGADMPITDADAQKVALAVWEKTWAGPNGSEVKMGQRLANESDQIHNLTQEGIDPAGTGRPKPAADWAAWGAANTTAIREEIQAINKKIDALQRAVNTLAGISNT